jgi:hypothetical protein
MLNEGLCGPFMDTLRELAIVQRKIRGFLFCCCSADAGRFFTAFFNLNFQLELSVTTHSLRPSGKRWWVERALDVTVAAERQQCARLHGAERAAASRKTHPSR